MPYASKFKYLVSGLTGRLGRLGAEPRCPACQSSSGDRVDRKYFHSLIECKTCGLLHRFPTESASDMLALYNKGYAEPGLTTDLPNDEQLRKLIESGFKDSEKDFSHQADVLEALGIGRFSKLLDYGANWGYASWQFKRRGLNVQSYEVSVPRAAFGKKIGIDVSTEITQVGSGFDAVYSCHVLEHVPNPQATILQQLSLVKTGGLVVAHTPNGSSARRMADAAFSLQWGLVHPVLLTAHFVAYVAGARPFIVSSNDAPAKVSCWNGESQIVDAVDGSGLFFAIRRVD